MTLQQLGRATIFLAGTIVGGLALAFVAVVLRPQLLLPASAPTSVLSAPAAVPASAPGGPTSAPAPQLSAGERQRAANIVALERDSYAAAVRRAAPAVVTIFTARTVTEQVQPSPLDRLFGDFTPRYRSGVQRALGSGVIVDAAGHVITNHHVIDDADTILVQLADGREARATVVGRDPDTDLAVLQIKLQHLPVMPLGRSSDLQVGDPVLAIGNPLGLPQTVTHGIISAVGRGQLGLATFESFIQTDAAINNGNSGGALINTQGELIGINTAVARNSSDIGGLAGIGFAIPVDVARGVMDEILAHGRVIRGWVGVVLQDIDEEQARQLGLAHSGVLVTNLYVRSPADTGGVRPGDILTGVDGRAVRNGQDALAQIAAKKPGSSLELAVLRGNRPLDLKLRVIEPPRSPSAS